MMVIIGLTGFIVLLILWYVSINNRLVTLKNNRENAFADIDVQLKLRHDLIPQLLGAVKIYMNHESGVLTSVTEARQKALHAKSINEKVQAENELSTAMGALNIQVEAYPDLKANANFMHLQTEITDIENKLAAVRRYFNSATKELNIAIEEIPSSIVAGIKKMSIQPLFDPGAENRAMMEKAPEIK